MTKCKECLHYPVCKEIYESVLDVSFKKIEDSTDPCRHFLFDKEQQENEECSWEFEIEIPDTEERCCSCPHCGGWVTFPDKPDYPFCPWCGKKVKLEDDD